MVTWYENKQPMRVLRDHSLLLCLFITLPDFDDDSGANDDNKFLLLMRNTCLQLDCVVLPLYREEN